MRTGAAGSSNDSSQEEEEEDVEYVIDIKEQSCRSV